MQTPYTGEAMLKTEAEVRAAFCQVRFEWWAHEEIGGEE